MDIKSLLKNKTFQKQEKESNWYQELGREMTAYFGKNCYFLPYRYEQWKLRQKFKEIQELPKEKRNFKYFIGMLSN